MKKLILLIGMLSFLLTAVAQQRREIYTIYADYVCIRDNASNLDYSDWKPCDIKIVINIEGTSVSIFSQVPQYFRILSDAPIGNGNGGFVLNCIDKDGIRSDIRVFLDEPTGYHIYVDYSDWTFGYLDTDRRLY